MLVQIQIHSTLHKCMEFMREATTLAEICALRALHLYKKPMIGVGHGCKP